MFGVKINSNIRVQIFEEKIDRIRSSKKEVTDYEPRRISGIYHTHQPYDAMGDFSFLLDEKSDKAENTTVENENINAD